MLFKNYIKIIYLNLFLQYTLDYTKKKKNYMSIQNINNN